MTSATHTFEAIIHLPVTLRVVDGRPVELVGRRLASTKDLVVAVRDPATEEEVTLMGLDLVGVPWRLAPVAPVGRAPLSA